MMRRKKWVIEISRMMNLPTRQQQERHPAP
jgi:hypothetical protein